MLPKVWEEAFEKVQKDNMLRMFRETI